MRLGREAQLSSPSRLKLFYLLHLSKPASDRPIYKEICRQKTRRIVELGVGTGERAVRMIQAAAEYCTPADISYTGVDLFETRSATDGPGISLKAAHCLLKATGARIQLVPGEPTDALARVANSLHNVDLLLITLPEDAERFASAWFYVPRLLHNESQVFVETLSGGNASLRLVDHTEIRSLANPPRRRAA